MIQEKLKIKVVKTLNTGTTKKLNIQPTAQKVLTK